MASYYYIAFTLKYYGKYSVDEVENMMPFERDVYLQLIQSKMEEEAERAEKMRRGTQG